MSDQDFSKISDSDFNIQLENLKEASARSLNPCLTAKYIALSDENVRTLFLNKFREGYLFRGIYCINGGISIPEQKSVFFDFDCRLGTFCLIKPAFLVIVDFVNGYVVRIIDPYIPTSDSSDIVSTAERPRG